MKTANAPDPPGHTALEYLGENLVLARARADISQAELAKKASIARTTISRLESGPIDNVDVRTVERLARALGVTLLDLLEVPNAEESGRAGDDDIPAAALVAAIREAHGLPRYSRAGRRRVER